MGIDIFKKYIWILTTIYRYKTISLKQLNTLYKDNESISDGNYFNERTFHRWREKIEEIFDIDIVCKNNLYSISNTDDLRGQNVRSWLLNTFTVNNLIAENKQLKERISMEDYSASEKFLPKILYAMKENTKIIIDYHKFNNVIDSHMKIKPFCIKSFHRRWYLLAQKENGDLRTYSLDRMESVENSNETFIYPNDFSVDDYFRNYYGVLTKENVKPEQIELKVYGKDVNYVRTLPLHHSQQEIVTTKDYSIFSFYLAPTYDFIQEILTYNNLMEILSPQHLREEIQNILTSTLERYQ
ncbi:MAG: WYL domain-containing protein [Bacteroidales bacterium]|nr:WYL domain-containing protein [Bacteroidales bacterium]